MKQSASSEAAGSSRPFLMEHRWGQRMRCRARVRLSAGAGITGAGRARDISASGAFIETALELPVCTQVVLVLMGNESASRTCELTASVVRVDRGGIGVEWCETPAGSVCTLVGCTTRCAALGRPS